VVLHPDGFDDPNLPDPNDIIPAYDIPAAIRRADGIAVPFEPVDARFLSLFKDGSADYHEAAFCYQIAAWTQALSNAAVSLFYRREEFGAAALTDRLAGAAIALRQLFHPTTAQYDYLKLKQRDPVGAELYWSTEAVARKRSAWPTRTAVALHFRTGRGQDQHQGRRRGAGGQAPQAPCRPQEPGRRRRRRQRRRGGWRRQGWRRQGAQEAQEQRKESTGRRWRRRWRLTRLSQRLKLLGGPRGEWLLPRAPRCRKPRWRD